MPTSIPNQRHLFDIPEGISYLNCAYMSPLMKAAQIAAQKGLAYKISPWTYTPRDFFSYAETYRALAAELISACAETIAIIPSVSYGMQIAANALPLDSGGEIIVLADQFPSNVYPWRQKATATGATVCTVARPEDQDWTRAILASLNAKTQIISLPATHWADGSAVDLEAISQAARAAGAALVLDLTQSLGALPFDVARVPADFMITAGYKWLLGPYTLGFMYIAPRWQEARPLEYNWMARKGAEDFTRLLDYTDDMQAGARRFDMGEKSNPAQLMAGSAALEQILAWGVHNISATLGVRNQQLAAHATELGLGTAPDHLRSPHFVSVSFPKGLPKDLTAGLAQQNIFVSARGASLRITPHLYNTDLDIDRLISALHQSVS